MVTPRAGNKRRGGSGISGGNKMSNKRFKPNMASIGVVGAANLFQTSQIPDNPGYLDFNDPLQTPSTTNNRNNAKGNKRNFKRNQGVMGNGIGHKLRQSNVGPSNSRGNNWGNKGNLNRNNRSSNRGNQIPPVQMGPPNRMGPRIGGGRGPMGPPPPPPIAMMGGPMPPIPPPNFMPSRMGPGPMGPPPMMGPPMPPLGPPRGPPRAMPGRRMGLRNSVMNDNPSNIGGSMRRGKHVSGGNKGKARKGNSNNSSRGNQAQSSVKNRSSKRNRTGSSKKTLKEIINQYSLDKPWVTDEIKAEAKIKEDIENRLKGKKDDKLFAEFKVQRDKFVALYEAAKKEHMEKKKKQQKVSNNETKSNESDKGEKNANTAAST